MPKGLRKKYTKKLQEVCKRENPEHGLYKDIKIILNHVDNDKDWSSSEQLISYWDVTGN